MPLNLIVETLAILGVLVATEQNPRRHLPQAGAIRSFIGDDGATALGTRFSIRLASRTRRVFEQCADDNALPLPLVILFLVALGKPIFAKKYNTEEMIQMVAKQFQKS